jgi:hypothetical protein
VYFDGNQLYAAFLSIFVAAMAAGLLVMQRDRARARTHVRQWGTAILCGCAALAVVSWTRFGDMHSIFVDAPDVAAGQPHRRKIEHHQPFHFHEFFHYYLGAKYFRDLGYEGLYDCTALADQQNAKEAGLPKGHVGEWVRDLDDVLTDKSFDEALTHCQTAYVDHMSPARWAAFRADLRELQTIVPDEWWSDVVYDAGFNPPPSWVLLGGALANIIPIHVAAAPTYLLATSLDMALLAACFLVLRRAFGTATAAMAGVFFGASFIASYGWNGGCFLRYTWVSFIVFGLAAAKRERWVLAGALLGAAACDRVFPGGFAVGAAVPLAYKALRSVPDRDKLKKFGIGFGGAVGALVVLSVLIFGFDSWRVFVTRIGRHGDVYYTMHIGLKKVITWRDWVASQNFHGHAGLQRFHDWNLRLRATWASMAWLVIPVQLLATGGAIVASARRRPYEAALLVGAVAMFCFSLPANYYYVVLALVPAVLLRAAITAPTAAARLRDWVVLCGFVVFWLTTLLAPKMFGDDIVYDHFICVALATFLGGWIVAWLPWQGVLARLQARSSSKKSGASGEPAAQTPAS